MNGIQSTSLLVKKLNILLWDKIICLEKIRNNIYTLDWMLCLVRQFGFIFCHNDNVHTKARYRNAFDLLDVKRIYAFTFLHQRATFNSQMKYFISLILKQTWKSTNTRSIFIAPSRIWNTVRRWPVLLPDALMNQATRAG